MAEVPAFILAILLCATTARAHDFWIEPSTFHPSPGTAVAVALRVGDYFIGDPVPRQSSTIDRFVVREAGQEERIGGSNNIDPAGFLRADGGETAVIGYSGGGSDIEMPPDRFENYLRLYGLDTIVRERIRRGETLSPGRERFYRYAKSLLTGARSSAEATRPLSFLYEIVPDADPTVTPAPFHGHILYKGHPLADVLVGAYLQRDPSVRLSLRTDGDGAFSFDLPQPGVWLIRSVHMVRAGLLSPNDWNSLWASLTFDLPGTGP